MYTVKPTGLNYHHINSTTKRPVIHRGKSSKIKDVPTKISLPRFPSGYG